MSPRFSELTKVRVLDADVSLEGFVVSMEFRDGRWIYKVSHPNPDAPRETYDLWHPESALELIP
jgi:hypothetical protein